MQLLVCGNDLTEDGLHALPDGRLFLWTGELRVAPREVSFEEARKWWTKFQSHAPYLASPFFPEGTDAERLVSMVVVAIQERERLARPVSAEAAVEQGRTASFVFSDMEEHIYRAMALLRMFSKARALSIESLNASEACGYNVLADEAERSLHAEWNAALEDVKALSKGTARPVLGPGEFPAVLRLNSAIAKAKTLLWLMANELGEESQRGGVCGHILLATDCSKALTAAYDSGLQRLATRGGVKGL